MPVIKTRSRQNLLDIAIQEQGDVATAFDLALNNGLSLTDDTTIGSEVKTGSAKNNEVVRFFNTELKSPASKDDITLGKGIGYWGLATTFTIEN